MVFFIDEERVELSDFADVASLGTEGAPVQHTAVLVGDAVGKSTLLTRAVDDVYHSGAATIGVDFKYCNPVKSNTHYKLKVWDVAGQERFKNIRQPYYAKKDVFLVCFDLTDECSFNRLRHWLTEITANATTPHATLILVGTKADKYGECAISDGRIHALMAFWNLDHPAHPISGYVATSAKTGLNVDLLFKKAAQLIHIRHQEWAAAEAINPRAQARRHLETWLQNTAAKKGLQGQYNDFLFFPGERGYNRNIDCAIARQLHSEVIQGDDLATVFEEDHVDHICQQAVRAAGASPGFFTLPHALSRSSLRAVVEECRALAPG